MYDSVLSLFGNDVVENIFAMITFADRQTPPVLEALKEGGVPCSRTFKFNNSGLYPKSKEETDDLEDKINNLFWKMTAASCQEFFHELLNVKPRSLALTKEVLKERENLEASIQGLQEPVRICVIKIGELEQEEQVLEKYKAEINSDKHFEYKVEVPKRKKIKLKSGIFVTNCLTCNSTCHFPCFIPKDKEKDCCAAMINGKCTVCVGSCTWDMHCNNDYRIEITSVTEIRTHDDLKKQYPSATDIKNQQESVRYSSHNYFFLIFFFIRSTKTWQANAWHV